MASGTKPKKARKPRPPIDPNETKATKFSRLGNLRVNKALKMIGLIGNLAGSGYEYTPEQVNKITTALVQKIKSTMARFDGTGTGPAANEFTV
jgi:ACT domain-containing protein